MRSQAFHDNPPPAVNLLPADQESLHLPTAAAASRFGRIRLIAGHRTSLMQEEDGAPGLDRTADTRFRKPVLYPLSYEGIVPICRGFSSATAGPEYQSCEKVAKFAGKLREAAGSGSRSG